MKLEYLYALVEVYHEKSITGAAQKLSLSDKTVHKYLNNLELEIGIKLTIRSSRGITFTEEGHAFYIYAYNTINNLESFKSSLIEPIKDYTIVSESKVFISSIIACSEQVVENYKIKFIFRELYKEEILVGLRDKEYDLGVITMDYGIPMNLEHYGLEFVPVTKRRAVVIVNENHPLACKDEISLMALKDYKRLVFENPFDDYYNYYYNLESNYGLKRGNMLLNYLGDMELMLMYNESYYYLGGISEQEARILEGVKVIYIKEIQDETPIGYVYNKEVTIDPVLQNLIDLVAQVAQN